MIWMWIVCMKDTKTLIDNIVEIDFNRKISLLSDNFLN